MRIIKINSVTLVFSAILVLLFFLGFANYLLFHSIIEILSVVVAGMIFLVTLSARKVIDNTYVIIVGTAYFFVGLFDLLHTFSYSGLNVFLWADSNLPTQLWLVARFLESLSILLALFLINSKIKLRQVFALYLFFSSLFLASIFYWHNFPLAYIEGQGLTGFKIYSEYLISFLLALSLYVLYRRRRFFNEKVFMYLNYSIAFTIAAEIVFTLYISVFSMWNIVGHILKLISFFYIYRSIAEIGIQKPQEVIFNNLKKSQERLARSEKKYQDLFDNMNSGFALHKVVEDEEGKVIDYEFVEVNDSFREVAGLQNIRIIGRRVTELIPGIEKDEANWIGRYARIAKKGTTMKFEQYSEALDRWFRINAYSPHSGYFATIIEDISESKRVEKERQEYTERLEELTNELFKFQLAVEDASEAISITDPKGYIVYANKATEIITGFSDKEIIGQSSRLWGNYLPSSDSFDIAKAVCIWDHVFTEDHRYQGEVINRKKDGTQYNAFLTISPVKDEKDRVIFYVCIERDITELKEVEKAKTDFIDFVSHELKTPLSSILLTIDILFRTKPKEFDSEQLSYLEAIQESSKEMSEFIEALLNVSRIESGRVFLESEPLDAGMEIRDLLDDLKVHIDNKSLKLDLDFVSPMPIIYIDEKVFKLITKNLLTNAINYSKEKGNIGVSIKKQGEFLQITVSDNGCGIPKSDQERVFEKLYRSSNAQKASVRGSGLGLYIVKNMLDKIGGKIDLKSEEGKGSKFIVSFSISDRS